MSQHVEHPERSPRTVEQLAGERPLRLHGPSAAPASIAIPRGYALTSIDEALRPPLLPGEGPSYVEMRDVHPLPVARDLAVVRVVEDSHPRGQRRPAVGDQPTPQIQVLAAQDREVEAGVVPNPRLVQGPPESTDRHCCLAMDHRCA